MGGSNNVPASGRNPLPQIVQKTGTASAVDVIEQVLEKGILIDPRNHGTLTGIVDLVGEKLRVVIASCLQTHLGETSVPKAALSKPLDDR